MQARSPKIFIVLAFMMAAAHIAPGQSLNAFNLDITSWPGVGAQFYAFDAQQQPLHDLTPADFMVTENGVTCPVTRVSCPAPGTNTGASVVLSMDISGSMGMQTDSLGHMTITLAQSAA